MKQVLEYEPRPGYWWAGRRFRLVQAGMVLYAISCVLGVVLMLMVCNAVGHDTGWLEVCGVAAVEAALLWGAAWLVTAGD